MIRKFIAHLSFLVSLLLLGYHTVSAQNLPAEGAVITNAIPPSPDAAALGKFGALPVGLFTGVPKIDIPLYTIKSGDLTLPLSISYHAGGIKIEEMASSVGLGWIYNFGGSITRTVQGLSDEGQYGILDTPYNVIKVDSLLQATAGGGGTTGQIASLNTTLNQIASGTFDGQSDIYNFNFAGYSGKFVLDSYGNVYILPRQAIKFTFVVQQYSSNPYIESFTAVTPDGVTYIFGSDNDGNDAVEFTNTNQTSPNLSTTPNPGVTITKKKTATAWFIKKMISPTGHQIVFRYTPETCGSQELVSQNQENFLQCLNCTVPGYGYTPAQNTISAIIFSTVKLNNIAFDNGNVRVVSNTVRKDLSLGGTSIDQLVISNSNGALNKTYNFYYTDTTTTRLRLDSLTGILPPGCNTCGNNHEKYAFQYIADPWTNSVQTNIDFSQDFWGYYNGAGNQTLIGAVTYGTTTYPGANRAPNGQALLGGMLTQITYPTGGYTVFTYDSNHQSTKDFGGESSNYNPPTQYLVAISNDPSSLYYDYDTLNHNPTNLVTLANVGGAQVPVTLMQSGLHSSSTEKTSVALWQLNAAGADSALVYNLYDLTSGDTLIYLNPGNYRLVASDPKSQAYPHPNGIKYTATAQWIIPNPATDSPKDYIAGGVRIDEIADFDGIHPAPVNLKTYQYTEPGSTTSSGHLNGTPSAFSYLLVKDVPAGGTQGDNFQYYSYQYLVQTATSNVPLGTSQGSVVGYDHVVETEAGGQNGKNEYYYTFTPDLLNPQAFPFSPSVDQSWMSGMLTGEINWRKTGDTTYAMVKRKVNHYSSGNSINIPSIKAGFNPTPGGYTPNANYYIGPMNFTLGGVLNLIQYYNNTNFFYLTSDTTKVYDLANPANYVTSYNSYGYDTVSFQISNRTGNNSKNELVSESVTYPDNYTIIGSPTSSALQGLLNLQASHILDAPIEEITQISNTDGSNLRTTKAVLTTYKPAGPFRDSIFESRSVTPVTSFTPSSAGKNSLNMDPSYQPVVAFNKYDAYGNIIQEQKVADAFHSYIWGYQLPGSQPINTYPIAEVTNADSAAIAYTNFESYNSAGYGNWTYDNGGTLTDATAPMGSQCYNLSSGNTISKTGFTFGTSYVVSFWAKTGAAVTVSGGIGGATPTVTGIILNGWQYMEYSVTNPKVVNISGTGEIDELRLYPANALMSTYTYLPGVGIASACNAKSQISYYQYDSVGRLVNITDQYGNIVKNYAYHYQGQ